jgi:hypothetical protein
LCICFNNGINDLISLYSFIAFCLVNNFDILDSTGRLLFYTDNGNFESNVLIFNWQKNIIELEFTVPFTVKSVSFSPDLNFCYLFTTNR